MPPPTFSPRSPRRRLALLVIDFDDTCTLEDTTSVVTQAAVACVTSAASSPRAAERVRRELEARVERLVASYTHARESLLSEILPAVESPAAEEFDMAWLGNFMDRMSEFERQANAAVEASGVLAGLTRAELAARGAQVRLRPGCAQVLARALACDVTCAVVSVNWSAELVRAALAAQGLNVVVAQGGPQSPDVTESPLPGQITVYANEVQFFGDRATGSLRRSCESGTDKGHLFDQLLLDLASDAGALGDAASVYVGDSMTDIPPLISADLGILVGRNPLFRRVARAAGIRVLPIARFGAGRGGGADQGAANQADQPQSSPALIPRAPPAPSAAAPAPLRIAPRPEGLATLSLSAPASGARRGDGLDTPSVYEASCWLDIGSVLFGGRFGLGGVEPSHQDPAAEGWARSPEEEAWSEAQAKPIPVRKPPAQRAPPCEPGSASASPDSDVPPSSLLSTRPSLQRSSNPSQPPEGSFDERSARPVSRDRERLCRPALGRATSQRPPHAQLLTPAGAVPRVLAVAGCDSCGGAGLEADIKAGMAAGVHVSCAVTAVTAQDTHGVQAVQLVPPAFVLQQMRAVVADVGADAIKTGMLPTPEIVRDVATAIREAACACVVVDPVIVSTSGHALAEAGVAAAMVEHLFPLATLITPNVHEAATLLGAPRIEGVAGMCSAARALHAKGPQWVLVTGGDLHRESLNAREAEEDWDEEPWELGGDREGRDEGELRLVEGQGDGRISQDFLLVRRGRQAGERAPREPQDRPRRAPRQVVDVLFDGRTLLELVHPYIPSLNSHGTGCTLATFAAAQLARGLDVPQAVRTARTYLWRTLERSRGLPLGSGSQRIMNFAWRTSDWAAELFERHRRGLAARGLEGDETEETEEEELAAGQGPASVAMPGHPQVARALRDLRAPRVPPLRIPLAVDLRLYAVTEDPARDPIALPDLMAAVRQAIDGGATMVQLRDKGSAPAVTLERAAALAALCRARGVPFVVNDRVDIALAIGADGVHLGQDDLPAATARKLIGPERILGVSVTTREEAVAAWYAGADYLGSGAVVASASKPETPELGAEGVRAIARAVGIPLVAIGGINETNVDDVVGKGVAGVALISAIFQAPDVAAATRKMRRRVDAALEAEVRGAV